MPVKAWLVVAMSSTLAGNLTLVGSIANLIVAERAKRADVTISFLDYLKVGLPLTLISIGLGAWLLAALQAPRVNRSLTLIGECAVMVVRRRLRAILFPLCLYCVSGAAGGYFVWHAVNGERGLKTKDEYQLKIAGIANAIARASRRPRPLAASDRTD